MTKYHITTAGKPAACTATERNCPLGGEHFESLRDAATAALETEYNAANPEPEPKPPTAKDRYAALADDELVSDEDREEFYDLFIKGLDRDPRGVGIAHFSTNKGGDLDGLTDEEFNALIEAQQKPIRLFPAEKKRRDEVCRAHKVSPEDVEAWAAEEPMIGNVTWRGEKVNFHPSRHLVFKDILGSIGSQKTMGFTEGNVAEAARWKRDKLMAEAEAQGKEMPTREQQIADLQARARILTVMAQTADTQKENIAYVNEREALNRQIAVFKNEQANATIKSTPAADRDPSHPYAPRGTKKEEESPRSSSGPKEIDPAMIEALKLKYLKKFKQPFDESGLSVGELLQMAQKGELG